MRCAVQLCSENRADVLDHGIAHAGNIDELKTTLTDLPQLGGHLFHFAKVQADV